MRLRRKPKPEPHFSDVDWRWFLFVMTVGAAGSVYLTARKPFDMISDYRARQRAKQQAAYSADLPEI